MNYLEIGFGMN